MPIEVIVLLCSSGVVFIIALYVLMRVRQHIREQREIMRTLESVECTYRRLKKFLDDELGVFV